jgi:hypothetical protein
MQTVCPKWAATSFTNFDRWEAAEKQRQATQAKQSPLEPPEVIEVKVKVCHASPTRVWSKGDPMSVTLVTAERMFLAGDAEHMCDKGRELFKQAQARVAQ